MSDHPIELTEAQLEYERTIFEAWAAGYGVDTSRWLDNRKLGYANDRVADYWTGWKARSRNQLRRPAARATEELVDAYAQEVKDFGHLDHSPARVALMDELRRLSVYAEVKPAGDYSKAFELAQQIRDMGCAVVVFTPNDLQGFGDKEDSLEQRMEQVHDTLEDILIERGWGVIQFVLGDNDENEP